MYHQRFKTTEQRFSEKYDVMENGCWQWHGADKDYPKFWNGAGYVRCNRFSLEVKLGRPLAEGEQSLHTCDNPRCVNPEHLFVGNVVENMRDRSVKGRGNHPRGAANKKTKLTDEQAREIRRKYAGGKSQDSLAAEYGISQSTISSLVRRETWNHLTD